MTHLQMFFCGLIFGVSGIETIQAWVGSDSTRMILGLLILSLLSLVIGFKIRTEGLK